MLQGWTLSIFSVLASWVSGTDCVIQDLSEIIYTIPLEQHLRPCGLEWLPQYKFTNGFWKLLKPPSVWAKSGVWHNWLAFILLWLLPLPGFGELCVCQHISLASLIAFNLPAFSTFEPVANSKKNYINQWVHAGYKKIHASNLSWMLSNSIPPSAAPAPQGRWEEWFKSITKGFSFTNPWAIRARSPWCTSPNLLHPCTHTHVTHIEKKYSQPGINNVHSVLFT